MASSIALELAKVVDVELFDGGRPDSSMRMTLWLEVDHEFPGSGRLAHVVHAHGSAPEQAAFAVKLLLALLPALSPDEFDALLCEMDAPAGDEACSLAPPTTPTLSGTPL